MDTMVEERSENQVAEADNLTVEQLDDQAIDGEDLVVYDDDLTAKDEVKEEVKEEKTEAEILEEWRKDHRFKEKTPDDVYKSYKEAERKLAEQGNELGTYRQKFDAIMQQALQGQQPQQQQPPDWDTEFWTNPKNVLEMEKQRIKQEIFQELGQYQSVAQNLEKYQEEHPDWQDIVHTPEFKEWKTKNVPPSIARVGDSDPETAAWVLSNFKKSLAVQEARKDAVQEQAVKRTMANNVAVGNQSNRNNGGAKVYRRTEIMKLMTESPAEYQRLQPEILRAYSEGRVK